jgi:hypothetical protein
MKHHLIWGTACGLVGLGAGFLAAEATRMIIVPSHEARFAPADPTRPDGAQIAVLWGDPQTGPSSMLLKLKNGAGPLHVHSSDYHLVLLAGTMKHWGERETQAQAAPLGAGSFWFQPGGQAHGDSCLSDECLMFVHWKGKRDGRLAPPPASR